MNNAKLNSLVLAYQQTKSDATFTEIYAEVSGCWSNSKTIAQSVRSNEAEVIALYEDTLMKAIGKYDGSGDFMNYYKRSVVNNRANLYRKTKRRFQQEVYEKRIDAYDGGDFEDNLFAHIPSAEDTEQDPFTKKRADQLALIDSFLYGADAKTTAIVEAFLAHPNPSVTAIAKALGMHHQQVIRALEKLAGKFDSKQHGDYRDYLVAL